MKKLVALLSLICIAGIGLSAQNIQSEKTDSIVFEKTTHDYGTIQKDADGNCEFKFTNTGEKPLMLSNVRASCGCTVPTWPRKPIQPGETGVIKVKYNTARVGSFNKSITVSSNAVNKRVVLRIKGTVKE
ncbi:MAG: DUF1573 domain-containing protein [Candidatus Delongbacteria bacterium]|jgi:hypothetical protein|nr:DUF1573 domain-containing protein [Candidatus Delongbacteria bacterium]